MPTGIARGSTLLRLGAALALALLADRSIYGLTPGLNVALWVAALVVVLLATRVRAGVAPGVRLVALAVLGQCVALALEPGPLGLALTATGVATLALWLRTGPDTDVAEWLGKLGAFALAAWRAPWTALRPLERHLRRVRTTGLRKLVANWLLPVVLSGVFVHLFCIANPVLAAGVRAVETALDQALGALLAGRELGRWLFGAAVATGVVALLRFRTRGWFAGSRDHGLSFRPDLLAPETVVRCLIMFNAVFALQTAIDAGVALTGGGLPPGMTFAEYAHRGAYPLIATALLAGIFVTLTFSSGQKAAEQRGARGLVHAWIAQNLVLLASTVYRHMLYVDAYGLSRWRLATIVWLGVVAAGFVLTARRIVTGRSNGWLLRANTALVVGVLYASAFVNWNGLIADYNARHCCERGGHGPSLDIAYLVALGPASLPALEAHLAALDGRMGPYRLDAVEHGVRALRAGARAARSDWRTWTLRAMLVDR